jgi:hypothetical protein
LSELENCKYCNCKLELKEDYPNMYWKTKRVFIKGKHEYYCPLYWQNQTTGYENKKEAMTYLKKEEKECQK